MGALRVFSGDRQRDSGVLPGDNSAPRRARAEAVQQGPAHSEDGLIHSGTFSERQIYIHGARRTRHRALHHIQKGKENLLSVIFLEIYIMKFCRFSQRILLR